MRNEMRNQEVDMQKISGETNTWKELGQQEGHSAARKSERQREAAKCRQQQQNSAQSAAAGSVAQQKQQRQREQQRQRNWHFGSVAADIGMSFMELGTENRCNRRFSRLSTGEELASHIGVGKSWLACRDRSKIAFTYSPSAHPAPSA